MARQLQLRRGTTSEHSTFTGAPGEVTVDTVKNVPVVHDGVTAGGFAAARESVVNTKVEKNADIVAGTATKVTYDSKGLVTSGSNPTTLNGYGITDAYTKTEVDNKDATLQTNIDTEKGRVDAILSSSSADKDSFKEIVDLINSVDTTNDNAFAGYVLSNDAAVALKAPIANPTFTGTVSGISKSMVGLSNVDNTSDANKPIGNATQSSLDLKAQLNNPVFTNHIGIGNTPISNWSSLKVVETGSGIFFGSNTVSAITGSNCYYDGQWKYKANGSAGLQLVNQGSHLFRVADAGVADAVITWTNVANIDKTGFSSVSGTNALPTYAFLSDLDTGIYNPAANELGFVTGGAERMRISASGNVGIGVTPSASSLPTIESLHGLYIGTNEANIATNMYYSSGYKLKNNGIATLYNQNNGIHRWQSSESGVAGTSPSFNNAMTLGSNGNLLVGTTTDNGVDKLQVNGSINTQPNYGIPVGSNNWLGRVQSSNNGGGNGIATSTAYPMFGELYAYNITNPGIFARYSVYKASSTSAPLFTLIQNNGLTVIAVNNQGTIAMSDTSSNIVMYLKWVNP